MQLHAALVMVMLLAGLSSMVKETQAACGSSNELWACLPAAQSDVQPSGQCCTQLSSYLGTNSPETCLCQAADSAAFESSNADLQYAITIPQKCNLAFKAGIQCNGITVPGGQ